MLVSCSSPLNFDAARSDLTPMASGAEARTTNQNPNAALTAPLYTMDLMHNPEVLLYSR